MDLFKTDEISISRVLIFCVEYRELSDLICDLSQAEKKINVVTGRKNTPFYVQIHAIKHYMDPNSYLSNSRKTPP